MGRFYERQGLLTREFDAGDISYQRWSAMEKYYEDNSLAIAKYYENHGLSQKDPDEVLAYRWNAASKFYKENPLVRMSADDILVYRWLALATFYQDKGLLSR